MLKSVLILDCGATNVKACLVDAKGKIIASHSLANETVPDPDYAGGLIWDIDSIWNKLSVCSRKICSENTGHGDNCRYSNHIRSRWRGHEEGRLPVLSCNILAMQPHR